MLIALLAVLGVDLIVLVALAAFVFARKRWVKRQPGAFRGAIRVASGEIDGLRPKWGRGYGHWVRDVLVWTKGPFLFRNEVVGTDDLQEHRPALPGEVKRLGDDPAVIRVAAGSAAIEVAAHGHDAELLAGPYREFLGITGSATPARTGPNGERTWPRRLRHHRRHLSCPTRTSSSRAQVWRVSIASGPTTKRISRPRARGSRWLPPLAGGPWPLRRW